VDLRLRLLAAAALAAFALVSTQASAQTPGSTRAGSGDHRPKSDTTRLSKRQAIAIANRDPKVRKELRLYPKANPEATFDAPSRWQVDYYLESDDLAQVIVDDRTGRVLESWTGYQVEWKMARGYPGAFGRKLNAPYVWIPLCAIFLLGLVDWRRPLRTVNLDLVVLLGFGASHFFFNEANIGLSVPLAYPVLVYLLARMLWVGFRGVGEGLRPRFPILWLAIATLFLAGFRTGLNVADSNVIDVGYSGVIGADRVAHGRPLYGHFPSDDPYGDTYGPVAYYAYVPFELIWPWHGHWDDLPAAHAAAVLFDLLTLGGMFLLGSRLRRGRAGRDLGVVLAFAWASYPYTAFALESNTNDSLVALLLVATLLLAARPLARGAALALAAATKFVPLILAPLFATLPDEAESGSWNGASTRRLRLVPLTLFALGFAGTVLVVMAPTMIDPGLREFYDRTIGFQASRGSPFSIWGQEPGLEGVQTVLKVGTVALALVLAFLPRRLDLARTAALAAALLLAVQLTVEHWFYLYIVWFFPLVAVALAAATSDPQPDGEPARSTPPGRPA
jgi:glycosyl transferase family 87